VRGATRARPGRVAVVWITALSPAIAQAQFAPRPLSRFDRQKAEWLLRRRLPCLGCHRLDGAGGVIGPDLSDVADRRTPAFIYRMVSEPQAALPGSSMPKIAMPDEWRALVVSYLAERKGRGAAAVDPPSVAAPGRLDAVSDGAALYQRVCAACHGSEGRGDGPNAANLTTRPTAHADSAYLSTRPDDTLFDGIFAGGYILNRSHLMPGWGETLSRNQLWGLVRYLRALCRCTGPAWSRDGAGGAGGAGGAAGADEGAEDAVAEGDVRRARSSR